ncbi:MAG: hypothetical protein HFJ50_08975 [Clostridia bacterium]|nr:hypothetical protein [Clostridia bacterium]
MQGSIEGRSTIGTIYKNSNFGVYGSLNNLNSFDLKSNKKVRSSLKKRDKTRESHINCNT